jgi:hypothetical protein
MTGGIEGMAEAGESALVADAMAGELRPGASRAGRGGDCRNCGTKLVGPHCHVCGQVADDLHRPFLSLVTEALEGLFAFDGRFLKTVPALVLRPGVVTKTYLDGARARYVPPFRLYLVSAIVFLLAASLVTGDWTEIEIEASENAEAELSEAEQALEEAAEEARAAGDPGAAAGLARAQAGLAAVRDAAVTGDAEAQEIVRLNQRREAKCEVRRTLLPEELGTCPPEQPGAGLGDDVGDNPGTELATDPKARSREDGGFNVEVDGAAAGDIDINFADAVRAWPIGVRRLLVHQSETVIDDPRRFLEAVNRWISRMLIGLFPVYAALLGLMHVWKRRFFYYDHVVVSLHVHSFLFILLTALIAASLVAPVWLLCVIFLLWSNLYVYRVHRKVYGGGRFSSVVRTGMLDFAYLIVLCFAPVLLAIGGFLTA